jgi:hypothetical protein
MFPFPPVRDVFLSMNPASPVCCTVPTRLRQRMWIHANTVLCGFMPAGTPEIRVVVCRCLLLVGSYAAARCTRLPELFVFRWQIDHVGYTQGFSKLWSPLVLFCN